jgi:hypothetical protein
MRFKTILIAAALASAQAFAATPAPLQPGKPAGLRQAQIDTGLLIPMGVAAGAVIAIVAATSDAGSLPTAAAITTTAPTGTAG